MKFYGFIYIGYSLTLNNSTDLPKGCIQSQGY